MNNVLTWPADPVWDPKICTSVSEELGRIYLHTLKNSTATWWDLSCSHNRLFALTEMDKVFTPRNTSKSYLSRGWKHLSPGLLLLINSDCCQVIFWFFVCACVSSPLPTFPLCGMQISHLRDKAGGIRVQKQGGAFSSLFRKLFFSFAFLPLQNHFLASDGFILAVA